MPRHSRRPESSDDLQLPPMLRGKIADLITADDAAKIVETLRAALDATQVVRAPRGSAGRNDYVELPDWRVRVPAAKILAEMRDGRPSISMDLRVSDSSRPMSRLEAARALMQDWESVRRIGDEHVRLLRQAIPVGSGDRSPDPPETPAAAIDVDVDVA